MLHVSIVIYKSVHVKKLCFIYFYKSVSHIDSQAVSTHYKKLLKFVIDKGIAMKEVLICKFYLIY